jgi:hypothetical protein
MKRNSLVSVLVSAAVLCWGLDLAAQSLGGSGVGVKENLDLPYDAADQSTSDEEAPEHIVFFGQDYEGDGFFFTVENSGGMAQNLYLARAKAELSRTIADLSDEAEFSVNFFDANAVSFPECGRPTVATRAMKSAALAWIDAIHNGSCSCCQKGFMGALRSANLSSARRKVIIYVGRGRGLCGGDESAYLDQCVRLVTAENANRVQINTIGLSMSTGPSIYADFLRAIAAANGGTYRPI